MRPVQPLGHAFSIAPARFILLVQRGDRIEPRLLSSASCLCRRMDAGLDIVMVSSAESLTPQLDLFLAELTHEGIPFRLKRESSMQCKDVVAYANTHECVLAVVIDKLANWAAPKNEKGNDPWSRLACPLVVAMPD